MATACRAEEEEIVSEAEGALNALRWSCCGKLCGRALRLMMMMTPHPGQVALDMAAAGLTVVTNTFENKTAEALVAISANLVAVEPTIEGSARASVISIDLPRSTSGAPAGPGGRWSRS